MHRETGSQFQKKRKVRELVPEVKNSYDCAHIPAGSSESRNFSPSIPQSLFFPSLQLLYIHPNSIESLPIMAAGLRESLWRRLWRNATTRWLFTRTHISLTRRSIFSLWIWFRGRGFLVSFRVFGCIAFGPHAKFIYLFSFILFGSDRTRHFSLKKSRYCCILEAASAPE